MKRDGYWQGARQAKANSRLEPSPTQTAPLSASFSTVSEGFGQAAQELNRRRRCYLQGTEVGVASVPPR